MASPALPAPSRSALADARKRLVDKEQEKKDAFDTQQLDLKDKLLDLALQAALEEYDVAWWQVQVELHRTPEGKAERLAEAEAEVEEIKKKLHEKPNDLGLLEQLEDAKMELKKLYKKEEEAAKLKDAETRRDAAVMRRDAAVMRRDAAMKEGAGSEPPFKTPKCFDVSEHIREHCPDLLLASFDPRAYFAVPDVGVVGKLPNLGDAGQRLDRDADVVVRNVMAELADRVLDPWLKKRPVGTPFKLEFSDNIGIDGPTGVGKTVLVYYIVCRLRREGVFTLYIPNCDELIASPEDCIRCAATLAVASVPGMMEAAPKQSPQLRTWRDLLERGTFKALQASLSEAKVAVVLDRQNKAWAAHDQLNKDHVKMMFFMADPKRYRQFVVAGSSNSEYFRTEWRQKTDHQGVCVILSAFSFDETEALLLKHFSGELADDAHRKELTRRVRMLTYGVPSLVAAALRVSASAKDLEAACIDVVEQRYPDATAAHGSFLTTARKDDAYYTELYSVQDQIAIFAREDIPTFTLRDGGTSLDKKLFLPAVSRTMQVIEWMFASQACYRVFMDECFRSYRLSTQRKNDLEVLVGRSSGKSGGELGNIFERFSIDSLISSKQSFIVVWQACDPSKELCIKIDVNSHMQYVKLPSKLAGDTLYVPFSSQNPVFDLVVSGVVETTDGGGAQIFQQCLCVIQITINSELALGHNPADILKPEKVLASRLASAHLGRQVVVMDDRDVPKDPKDDVIGISDSGLMYIYWTPLRKDFVKGKVATLPKWVWVVDVDRLVESLLPREVVENFMKRAGAR